MKFFKGVEVEKRVERKGVGVGVAPGGRGEDCRSA